LSDVVLSEFQTLYAVEAAIPEYPGGGRIGWDCLQTSKIAFATEGVAEAMHWLREDVDGVIYVLDSATDPFTQVNTMLIGIIESQDLPVLILANKIDLEDSSVQRIRNAYPQHETIPLSALEGDNMDEVYDKIAEYFG